VHTQIGDLEYFPDPFFGTSAAAPHVAGIAALMLDANSSLSPAQVQQFLRDTAVDLTAYGAGYDNVSGAGRFDALGAVFKAFVPATPDPVATSDWGFSTTDNKTFDTTPTFTGTVPANAHVWLYVDGSAVANAAANGAGSYTLTPSSALSTGTKSITIKVAENGSVAEANRSQASAALSLVVSNSDSVNLGAQAFTARMSETLDVTGSNTGSSTLTINWGSPARALTKTGTGTATISTISERTSTVTYNADAGTTVLATDAGISGTGGSANTANWTINADATVTFNTTQNLAALNVEDAGVVTLAQNGSRVLVVNLFTVAAGGKLDLKDNDMIIHAPTGTSDDVFDDTGDNDIYGALKLGWDNGDLDGLGIMSSTSRDNINLDTGLGYLKNSIYSYTSFAGQTVNNDSILIKYTYWGDIDLDGDVDADDLTVFANNLNVVTTGGYWWDGDFDFDGDVDADDNTLFGNNYGKGVGNPL
jgi:hypothetical protein